MLFVWSSAECCYCIQYTMLCQRYNIHISFHYQGKTLILDFTPGFKQSVEFLAFMKQHSLG